MPTSYNGWRASKDPGAIDIDPGFTAAGRTFPGGVKRGPVSVVLRYVVEQFDKRVEEVDLDDPGDEWGYTYKPSANSPNLLSCHSSGTAVDINATRHPNGTHPSKTFTPTQISEIRAILAEVDGVVRWLGDATGTPDPMHFEIRGDAVEVARVAGRILNGTPAQPQPTEDFLMTLTDAEQKEVLAAVRQSAWPANTPANEQHRLWNLVLWTLSEVKSLRAEVAALKDT
jgi:hypothetical protein